MPPKIALATVANKPGKLQRLLTNSSCVQIRKGVEFSPARMPRYKMRVDSRWTLPTASESPTSLLDGTLEAITILLPSGLPTVTTTGHPSKTLSPGRSYRQVANATAAVRHAWAAAALLLMIMTSFSQGLASTSSCQEHPVQRGRFNRWSLGTWISCRSADMAAMTGQPPPRASVSPSLVDSALCYSRSAAVV